MNATEMNQRFPDLKKSQQALLRAAERARHLAEQTGTRLIVKAPEPKPAQNKSA